MSKETDKVMAELNKRFGPNMIRKANTVPVLPRVTTGSLTLDWGFGGGIPTGRIIEFYGYESTGKSLMSLNAVKQFQMEFPDLLVGWVDCEGVWDADWVERIGIDAESVYLAQPDTGNQAFDIIESMIRTREFSLIVLDSFGMATAQQEIERSMEDYEVGVKARMGNKGIRKVQSALNYAKRADVETSLILINHIYLDLSGFRAKKVTPGGKGKEFADSLKVEFMVKDEMRLPKEVDPNETQVGIRVGFYVKKSKVGTPHREGEFELMTDESGNYHPGSITRREYIAHMLNIGLLERSGSWYTLVSNGERFQGIDNVQVYLEGLSEEGINEIRGQIFESWNTIMDEREDEEREE